METQSFYTRKMLLQYGRQLVTARRLARYSQLLGYENKADQREAARQRALMVERIAKEITENLIFSGSENGIVQEVLAALKKELGEELLFRYPPDSLNFMIFTLDSTGKEHEVDEAEKQRIMHVLWQVALRVVDKTMI